jgi:hypothetical protein
MITNLVKTEQAIKILNISRNAFDKRKTRLKIKNVKRGYYSFEDIQKMAKPKKRIPTPKKEDIIIYKPFRIIETYHIYESKMNYDPTI